MIATESHMLKLDQPFKKSANPVTEEETKVVLRLDKMYITIHSTFYLPTKSIVSRARVRNSNQPLFHILMD